MTLEREGVPTGTIVTTAFSTYGRVLTRQQSMERLPLVVLPHPIAARDAEEVRQVTHDAFGDVVESLVARA